MLSDNIWLLSQFRSLETVTLIQGHNTDWAAPSLSDEQERRWTDYNKCLEQFGIHKLEFDATNKVSDMGRLQF